VFTIVFDAAETITLATSIIGVSMERVKQYIRLSTDMWKALSIFGVVLIFLGRLPPGPSSLGRGQEKWSTLLKVFFGSREVKVKHKEDLTWKVLRDSSVVHCK
jgi:hypothetical protein